MSDKNEKTQMPNEPDWLGTLWNVNPGLARRAEAEILGMRNFMREVIIRGQLTLPTDEQELEWFEQGITPDVAIKIIVKTNEWNPKDSDV